MSRKFPKSKQREARAKVAALSTKLDAARAEWLRTDAAYRELSARLAEVLSAVEEICEHSMALPPKRVAGIDGRKSHRIWLDMQANKRFVPGVIPSPGAYRMVDVHALEVYLNDHVEDMQAAVHLTYETGLHSVYMVSERSLRDMSERRLMQQIVPEVARVLIKYLRAS